MSDLSETRLALVKATDTIDEVEQELLFLSVAIGHSWDDNPTMGCVLIIDRLRATLKTVSATVYDATRALAKPQSPEPPPFEPTPEMEAIARRFREDWDRAGRDAAAKMKASRDMHQEEATHD